MTHAQLAAQTTRAPVRLDPFGSASGALALLLTIAAYLWLGRRIRVRGGAPRTALLVGLAGGIASGLGSGLAPVLAVSDYLADALSRVSVPPLFLPAALGLYAALLTVFWALVAAASAWCGARGAPPRASSTHC
ncbi:MAG: hypothetical protein EXR61_03975 [Chloroflexi bacterium]|nr:hypothetical protein [Chloroflexota bacterium]